jgi:hypothetical protein
MGGALPTANFDRNEKPRYLWDKTLAIPKDERI